MIERGGVFIADLTSGRRPVVVVTRDVAIPLLRRVTVAPITRRVRGIDTEVPVGRSEGLPTDSVVNCDNLETIAQRSLDRRLGTLGPERRRQLDHALRIALELDE